MPRLCRALLVVALAFAPLATPSVAYGKPKVTWVRVDVPKGEDAGRLERAFRKALTEAAKTASFGDDKVELTADLKELSVSERGGVLRVRCSATGRLVGGASAKSHIDYGGRPGERAKLEGDVLGMVARGLVSRLAELARRR